MSKPLHPMQTQLLQLATEHDIANMRLVDVARLLDEPHLQRVKHHREQLIKHGILVRQPSKAVTVTRLPDGTELLRIPILEFKR